MFDVIIEGGALVDGTGGAATRADLGINGTRLAALGNLDGADARRRLDARGCVVCPGFIDLHTHCGFDPKHRTDIANMNYLQQGVTTVVGGNCGFSPVNFEEARRTANTVLDGPNLAMLVGHNSLRLHVMGLSAEGPSDAELAEMKRLAAAAMDQGAIGMSSGPFYVPGAYAKTDEMAALATVAAQYAGLYATHIRSESDGLEAAVQEAIAVGRESGAPVQLSHHKAQGLNNWGMSRKTLAMIDEARTQDVDVTLDLYPYTASCSRLGTLMPDWVCAGSDEEAHARLADEETRATIREAVVETFNTLYGGELERIQIASSETDPSLCGLTFADIANRRGAKNPYADMAEFVMELAYEHPASCDTMCTSHLMCEDDLVRILAHPSAIVASDGWGVSINAGHPHPRLYGTFPRVLARYCREQQILTLETAIRKMTSMPAARLGFADRGTLREGARADVTIFDPHTVEDRATFEEPHRYPAGIAYVIINGKVVLDHGDHTGALPGVFLGPKGKTLTQG